MFLTILILSSLLGLYYRNTVHRLFLKAFLGVLKVYVYFLNILSSVLPTFIFVKVYNHKSSDTDFSVHEYYYNHRGRFYTFKMVETLDYDINHYFDKINLDNLYDIHHACVLNNKGEYVRDITAEIRHFMHLRKMIEWKYILVHLGIENDNVIIFHKNDEDLSEKFLYVKDVYNEKFDF